MDFFYSINLSADPNYIPIPIYLLDIEPILNQAKFVSAISDKNSYDKFLKDIQTPRAFLRKINHEYYNEHYGLVKLGDETLSGILRDAGNLILKPSIDSGGGKHILLFKKIYHAFKNESAELNSNLLADYPDFVLQEAVTQHRFFQQFNPDSNNTIRILTYRSVADNQIHILHRLLRVGKKGAFLDHDNLGGITIGISGDSKLNAFGTDSWGIKVNKFNGIDFNVISQVPFLEEIEHLSKNIANQVYYGRLLALDFTVNDEGTPLLLEINCLGNGVSQYQMNNGSLFKEFTNEILEYSKSKYLQNTWRKAIKELSLNP